MSGLSDRTFRVSGLFQTGHFPGFQFVPSRTPDWYKPELSSELKFRLRPTLRNQIRLQMPQERAGGEDDEEEQQQARVLLRISRSVSKVR
jgi:hypothetical protein